MLRQLSMTRRRPNFVDLMIPRQSGVDGYRIQTAPTMDAVVVWTTRFTAPIGGFVDPAVNLATAQVLNLPTNAFGPAVRCIFDPATYSITDTVGFWLRFVPVTGGSPGTPGAATLVLPDSSNHGLGVVVIHATAPLGADATAALQLDLPRIMTDMRFQNEDGANPLFVSFEQNGAETKVAATQSIEVGQFGTQASIWVRAGTAAVAFSATMTMAFPR